MEKKLLILDGHSLAHRAFYALPLLTNAQGEYTNAVLGFATMFIKLIEDENPTHVVVAFDKSAPTFRHLEYDAYKANRKKMPEEMRPQMALIRSLVGIFGIPVAELEGYEADDVIGTLAKRAEDETAVIIVTGDRDALQLVDGKISVMLTKKGISEVEKYDPGAVFAKYGIRPDQVPDLKGLMGDASDNIPGVPGVGEKTAVKLIQEFGTVESLVGRLEAVPGKKLRETLTSNVDQALLSKKLATIDTDAPIGGEYDSFAFNPPELIDIKPFMERLEFKTLLKRIEDGKVRFIHVDKDRPAPEDSGHSEAQAGATEDSREVFAGDIKRVDMENLREAAEIISKAKVIYVDYHVDGHPMSGELSFLAVKPGYWSREDTSQGCCTYVFSVCGELSPSVLLTALGPFFESPEVLKIIHDAKPLCTYLRRKGITLQGLQHDTIVAAYLLNSTARSYSIENLAFEYANLRISDANGKDKTGQPDDLFFSSAHHRLMALNIVADILQERIAENDMASLYREIEIPLVSVLAEMESNGVKIDAAKLQDLSKVLGERLEELQGEIYEKAGCIFNINSPKQLAEILFIKLGLPAKKKTATGFSTDVEVLEELAEEHEIAGLILEYRQVGKLKSTYADSLASLVNPETGRVHSTFNQVATATGRLSSTEPNLQNIPIRTEEGRKIREVFVPEDKDAVLVTADYSQIELRILAHVSQDPALIEAFNSDQDIHVRTASEVFGVSPENVTKTMRNQAKAVNFGIVYGISGFGLGRGLGISRQEAQRYIDSYLERYQGVKDFIRNAIEGARINGYVTTLFNRRRYLPDITSRKWTARSFAERTAMNTPIQGTAADIIKAAMVDVSRALQSKGMKSKLILQVHDELVLEVPIEEKEAAKGILKEKMENVARLSVSLQVDVKSGSNWNAVITERTVTG